MLDQGWIWFHRLFTVLTGGAVGEAPYVEASAKDITLCPQGKAMIATGLAPASQRVIHTGQTVLARVANLLNSYHTPKQTGALPNHRDRPP